MYKGKYSDKAKRRLAPWVALVLALVLTLSVGGTIAYLVTDTNAIQNTFIPGKISCKINEDGWEDGNTVKQNVTVTNTGNADAFIRAAIVMNWINSNGEYAPEAVEASDYEITLGSGWTKNGDYYYWSGSVAPNGTTGELIKSCEPVTAKDGYTLCVEILADAIQAAPTSVAQDNWGYVPSGN